MRVSGARSPTRRRRRAMSRASVRSSDVSGSAMRVLQVSAYFAPAFRYGGPPRSILGLCQALANAGADIEVFTTTANGDAPLPPAPDGVSWEGVRVRYFPLAWPSIGWRASGLAGAPARATHGPDLIHV